MVHVLENIWLNWWMKWYFELSKCICLTRKNNNKLHLHCSSRDRTQRKSRSVHSFTGFTWLPMDKTSWLKRECFQVFSNGLKWQKLGLSRKALWLPWCINNKQKPPFQDPLKFCSSRCLVAEWNLIHVNDFGCLARDWNLAAVFSMAVPFCVKTTASLNVL